jgi:hypothetical protein
VSEANGGAADPGRNKHGRFLPGHRSLGGRKKGSRNLLSERFLADMHGQWLKSGKRVLQIVAEREPAVFLKVVAAVLPRVMEVDGVLNVTHRTELEIEVRDFAEAYERWGKVIGASRPMMIETEAIEHDDAIETNDEQIDD